MKLILMLKEKVAKTIDVINTYKKDRRMEKKDVNNKDRITALDTALYEVIRIWNLHITIPILLGLILILYLIKLYIVEILGIGFLLYVIYEYIKPKEFPIDHENRYRWLQDYLYKPFSYMKDYLPVEPLQSLSDIVNPQKFVSVDGYAIYIFQLLKSTYEDIDDNQIRFAKKVLQARIIQKMDEYEKIHGTKETYYKDERVINVDEITDVGTHYIVSILYIDNPLAYEYWKYKNSPRENIYTDNDDEDFR